MKRQSGPTRRVVGSSLVRKQNSGMPCEPLQEVSQLRNQAVLGATKKCTNVRIDGRASTTKRVGFKFESRRLSLDRRASAVDSRRKWNAFRALDSVELRFVRLPVLSLHRSTRPAQGARLGFQTDRLDLVRADSSLVPLPGFAIRLRRSVGAVGLAPFACFACFASTTNLAHPRAPPWPALHILLRIHPYTHPLRL